MCEKVDNDVEVEEVEPSAVLPPDKLALVDRWRAEGRWKQIKPLRDRFMAECRHRKMSKAEAQAWTYAELDQLYPATEPEVAQAVAGQIRGLSDLPDDWPELPSNASIQAELSWVQANRLGVITITATGATVVRLRLAREPAPSRGALAWLETSIRHNAKYVDVCVRSLKDEQDEQEHVRRERKAIAEIYDLLAEMHEDPAA